MAKRPTKLSSFRLEQSITYRLHSIVKITDRRSHLVYRDDAGISISEGRCLAAIASFCPISVNHLAQRANLTPGQASRASQSLVDQGFVVKEVSDLDKRGVVLMLTPKGRELWRKLEMLIARRNEQIVHCLSADEKRQLDGMLDRILAHVRQTEDPAIDDGDATTRKQR